MLVADPSWPAPPSWLAPPSWPAPPSRPFPPKLGAVPDGPAPKRPARRPYRARPRRAQAPRTAPRRARPHRTAPRAPPRGHAGVSPRKGAARKKKCHLGPPAHSVWVMPALLPPPRSTGAAFCRAPRRRQG